MLGRRPKDPHCVRRRSKRRIDVGAWIDDRSQARSFVISEQASADADAGIAQRFPGEIAWPYSIPELWADGVVHASGVALAIVGAVLLAVAAAQEPTAELAAVAVYLATLILSLGVSAAYNLWPVSRLKWMLRRFDHSAIYLLIAGTYTPFMVLLESWDVLVAIWLAAAIGIALKIVMPGRFDRLSIGLYLLLGWSGALIAPRLLAVLSSTELWLIAVGGLTYSVGVLFHVWDRLRFQNAVWHGFVVTAASIHYVAIWSAVTAA